ncbi:MAG TPA: hypothetical protein VF534_06880 [Paraburkholderia sp.]
MKLGETVEVYLDLHSLGEKGSCRWIVEKFCGSPFGRKERLNGTTGKADAQATQILALKNCQFYVHQYTAQQIRERKNDKSPHAWVIGELAAVDAVDDFIKNQCTYEVNYNPKLRNLVDDIGHAAFYTEADNNPIYASDVVYLFFDAAVNRLRTFASSPSMRQASYYDNDKYPVIPPAERMSQS